MARVFNSSLLTTIVASVPEGWLVTHCFRTNSGAAIHSIIVNDAKHECSEESFITSVQREEENNYENNLEQSQTPHKASSPRF